jgi:hypothetical protein
MRRREFIAGLVSAVGLPITASAQQLAVPESSGQSVGGAHQPGPTGDNVVVEVKAAYDCIL